MRSSVDQRPLLDEAASDPEVRAVVVTGAGGAFCVGGDLGSFDELHDARVYRHVSHPLSELMDAVERLEKPVVAAAARARRMLRRAPLSFGAAKRLLHVAADADTHSTMLAESLAQAALLATADHREGLAAARERREPEFNGR